MLVVEGKSRKRGRPKLTRVGTIRKIWFYILTEEIALNRALWKSRSHVAYPYELGYRLS